MRSSSAVKTIGQFFYLDKARDAIVSFRNRLSAKALDANWFARFLKIANEEDFASGITMSDPMRQHAWVNIAVSAIARNLSRAQYKIELNGEPIETVNNPVYRLFTNVNPYMSRYQLWEATVSWRSVRGEAFWIFEPDYAGGLPREIYLVNPNRMSHRLNPDKTKITLWEYTIQGTAKTIPLLPDELIHYRVWNKWDDWRGINPLVCMGYELSQDYQANISNTRLLQNRSVPHGVLSTERPVSEIQAEEIRDRWEKEHKGASRAHKIAVLGHGTKYQTIELSPSDMAYFEMKKWNRHTILSKYGVPPAAVGIKDDSSPLSGKDTQEQMKAFWNLTLIPEIRAIEDKLRTDFYDRFHIKERGHFDLTEIEELQEDEELKAKRQREDVNAGILLINEVRKIRGLDPVPWGDDWWISFSQVPAVGGNGGTRNVTPEKSKPKFLNSADFRPAVNFDIREIEGRIAVTAVKRNTIYTEKYKAAHWWKTVRSWEPIEEEYKKAIQDWFFDQRSKFLTELIESAKSVKAVPLVPGEEPPLVDPEWFNTLRDLRTEWLAEEYWEQQEQLLKQHSEIYFVQGMEATGGELLDLFDDLGLDVRDTFDIYETGALDKIKFRVNKGKLAEVTDTVREKLRGKINSAISEGWDVDQTTDEIRSVYNQARNRATAIARTEMGGAINDSRVEGFKAVGVKKHSWLSARDGTVREPDKHSPFSHSAPEVQGPIEIGELFETGGAGLTWPNAIDGEAGNVINCRCTILPEIE